MRLFSGRRGAVPYSVCAVFVCVAVCVFSGRRGAVPYKICALFFHRTNIGDFSGSRWPLKNSGSYCSVCAQTMPILAPNYGTGQSTSLYIQLPPDLKSLGGVGGFTKAPRKTPRPPRKNRAPMKKAHPTRWARYFFKNLTSVIFQGLGGP